MSFWESVASYEPSAEDLAVTKRPFVGPGQSALRVDPATDRLYLARRGTARQEVDAERHAEAP